MLPDFPNGLLWMSREALPDSIEQLSWSANPVNAVLIVACLIILICDIKDFFVIWRPLVPGLVRWKPLLALEHNMQLARTRNRLAGLLLLPTCLIADWASLTHFRFYLIAALVIGFVLLRWFLSLVIQRKKVSQGNWNAARHAMYSIFIVLSVVMLISTGILSVSKMPVEVRRITFYSELGLAYVLSIIREGQILSAQCGPFRAFLYLCGLELLPGAAVASATLLFV